MLALLRGNEEGWGSTGIVAALAGAAVLLIAFVVVEQRSREPMLPLRLMGDRRFAGAQVAVFAIAASFFAVFLYLTLYLQTVLGMSPIETGLVYLPGTFLVFVVSGMTAQLGAKFSPAKIACIGLGLVAVGLALMLFAGVGSSWTVLLPGLLVTSVGHRAVQSDRAARSPSTRCPPSRAGSRRAPTTPSARPASRSGSPPSGPWCRRTRRSAATSSPTSTASTTR